MQPLPSALLLGFAGLSIEVDLLDLLTGRASGVLSLRADLAPESPKP